MVDFNHEDEDRVSQIADRVVAKMGIGFDRISFVMDVMASNGENGNDPLNLEKWLAFDDFSFFHDAFGISEHLNRATGLLENSFLPRCSA